MRKLVVALSFLLLSSQAFALDVAGVNVAPTVSAGQKTLTLNGAGIRTKFFVKVYVGSLYTERKVTSATQLLADPGEKLVRMSFVHKKVEKNPGGAPHLVRGETCRRGPEEGDARERVRRAAPPHSEHRAAGVPPAAGKTGGTGWRPVGGGNTRPGPDDVPSPRPFRPKPCSVAGIARAYSSMTIRCCS
ncbi:MAG: hypothetical protein H6Q81_1017 [Deltaproteobacteria bacterium]|nr:hypothetical protein [Deltaproteobacteria bacterium]